MQKKLHNKIISRIFVKDNFKQIKREENGKSF